MFPAALAGLWPFNHLWQQQQQQQQQLMHQMEQQLHQQVQQMQQRFHQHVQQSRNSAHQQAAAMAARAQQNAAVPSSHVKPASSLQSTPAAVTLQQPPAAAPSPAQISAPLNGKRKATEERKHQEETVPESEVKRQKRDVCSTPQPKKASAGPRAPLPAVCDSVQLAKRLIAAPEADLEEANRDTFVRRSTRERGCPRPLMPEPSVHSRHRVMADDIGLGFDENGRPGPALVSALAAAFPAVGTSRLCLNQDPQKGLCVTTSSFIPQGAFVIEYAGALMTEEEGRQAEERYAEEVGCFSFYFRFKRKRLCIDSTAPAPGVRPGTNLAEHVGEGMENVAPLPPSPLKRQTSNGSVGSSQSSPRKHVPAASSTVPASPPAHPSTPPSASLHSEKRLETLGYGFARYINHSRQPNLSAKIVDAPSSSIRTDRYPPRSESDLEAEEQERERRRKAQKKKARRKNEGERKHREEDEEEEESMMDTAPSAVDLNLSKTYPRLCFYANRPILQDEELTIDYGDRDPESVADFPWLLS
jgi:hypothetical protein